MTTTTKKVPRSVAKPSAPSSPKPKAKKKRRNSRFTEAIIPLLEKPSELLVLTEPVSAGDIAARFARDALALEANGREIVDWTIDAAIQNASAATPEEAEALKANLWRLQLAAIAKVSAPAKAELSPYIAGELADDLHELLTYARNCYQRAVVSQARYISRVFAALEQLGVIGKHARSKQFAEYTYVEHETVFSRGYPRFGDHERRSTAAPGFLRGVKRTTHRHSIVDVRCTPVEALPAGAPEYVKQLVSQVPECIAPLVKVLQGDIYQVREREELLTDEFEPFVHEEQDRHEVILDDPAIVIGGLEGIGYVLTGWLDKPVEPVSALSKVKPALPFVGAGLSAVVAAILPLSIPVSLGIALSAAFGFAVWGLWMRGDLQELVGLKAA